MIIKDGMVAVQHYSSNPWIVKIDDTVYTWTPRHNVSLAWIKEEDVAKILQIRNRACCGRQGQRFYLASQINVNLWETGDRHGEIV